MIRAFSIAFVCLIGVAGCVETKKPLPPVPVKGSVTLDGKPMAVGEVTFSLLGEVPSTLPVKDGTFSGQVLTGTNRVEIRAYKPGPPLSTDPNKEPTKLNFIPDRFNGKSQLSAEVGTGQTNDFKFEVTSR